MEISNRKTDMEINRNTVRCQLNVRISVNMRQALEYKAKHAGMSIGEYVRASLQQMLTRDSPQSSVPPQVSKNKICCFDRNRFCTSTCVAYTPAGNCRRLTE